MLNKLTPNCNCVALGKQMTSNTLVALPYFKVNNYKRHMLFCIVHNKYTQGVTFIYLKMTNYNNNCYID